MIVKKMALVERDGTWTFRNALYSGAALEFLNGTLVSGERFDCGRYIDAYRSEFISGGGVGGVESERDYTGEQFFWRGEAYNGFAYEFSGDICVSERLFEYGWIVAEVTYYPSGKLRTVEIGEDVTQNYEWFENGDLRRVMLCQNDAFMLSLLFSRGLLERLTLMRDYFGRVPAVAEPIIFPILQAKQELSTFLCSAQFSLGGSGVDAEVVKYLLIGDSGRLVRSLHLDRVPGSPQLFEYLSALHQITELKVDADKGNYGDWSKWCAEFKLFHAGCNVHLNGREISQASR
ncbi:hypothetical protein E2H86_05045 [Pseudomonas putida]|uniref:hypothetical protein n=1 Tax=Pseudomonas putida TaxID=303 RepID=UPI00105A01B3|nr:hypothetical protein [Pseudomonas putida]TDJ78132.1 hypothetical protein E2H86_05045 [Pseudomonas putida]